jgi:hypothetical protein
MEGSHQAACDAKKTLSPHSNGSASYGVRGYDALRRRPKPSLRSCSPSSASSSPWSKKRLSEYSMTALSLIRWKNAKRSKRSASSTLRVCDTFATLLFWPTPLDGNGARSASFAVEARRLVRAGDFFAFILRHDYGVANGYFLSIRFRYASGMRKEFSTNPFPCDYSRRWFLKRETKSVKLRSLERCRRVREARSSSCRVSVTPKAGRLGV